MLVEVGCGKGVVSVYASNRADYVVGVDIAWEAVRLSRELARASKECLVDFVQADMLNPFRDSSADVVASNPPYLPCDYREDPLVCGGEDGVEFSARLAREAFRVLRRSGELFLVASSISNFERLLDVLRGLYASVEVAEERRLFFEKLFCLRALKP